MSLFFSFFWVFVIYIIHYSSNPTWNETKYILINNLNDQLILSVYDYNGRRKNTKVAFATFELGRLIEDASQEDLVSPLLKEGKNKGELRYDVTFYPVVENEVGVGKEEILDSSEFASFHFLVVGSLT